MGCVCGKQKGNAKSTRYAAETLGKDQEEELIMVDDFSAGSDEDGGIEVFGETGVEEDEEDYGVGNLGLQRVSRLSSQFLPPSGCKITQVPEANFELRYSFLSQRGYYPEALDKANQDSFCVHTHFGKNPNDHFFGVFDGHGEFGAQCSQFVKRNLCDNLLRHRSFSSEIERAYHAAFVATNAQLHRSPIDDSMSGTTAVTVLVRGRMLHVANLGDSRAVLAELKDGKLTAVDLSSDQTPFRADECERVKKCGARVLTLDQLEGLKSPAVQCWGGEGDDDGDPPRLWVPNGMYPGTAFTRSVGDTVAERIGVIAVPEVKSLQIGGSHPFFVVASDGVFEFLTSQDVVDMVAKYNDPRDACAAVVAESYRLWLQYETRTDDITIIVVNIDGLEEASALVTREENTTSFRRNSDLSTSSHELSAARLRAIEASLDNDVGSSPLNVSNPESKTVEDKARIRDVLDGNFLFHNLSESQWETLFNCVKRISVQAGDILIRQGAEDDHFYIVETGEFEVLVAEEGNQDENDLGTVVNHYDAHGSACFGDLALMHNKPRQASVRAVTKGTLWMLTRQAFRGVLLMNTRRSALKHLRSIGVLAKLSIEQLILLADALSEARFKDGEVIIDKERGVHFLYIVRSGCVDLIDDATSERTRKVEGDYFGEWVLGEPSPSLIAVAAGDAECWAISRESFESTVGQLDQLMQEELKLRHKVLCLRRDAGSLAHVQLTDLEWEETVYTTDCCEVGIVTLRTTGQVFSIKRYPLETLRARGRELQVLQEKSVIQELKPSAYVPQVLCTRADDKYAAMLLDVCLAGPLSLILHSPLKEESARYICASLVDALDALHKDNVVYRGVSPDILMLDRNGRLQLVDLRFAKKLHGERTFTVCGMADFLAPEIIKGQGHDFAADWWALGVLLYWMLQAELPFGSWRDSELDIYSRIAGRQLAFPATFSNDVVDLIDKLLVVDASSRLRAEGIRQHAWFRGFDWSALAAAAAAAASSSAAAAEENADPHAPPPDVLRRLQSALKLSRAARESGRHGIAASSPPPLQASSAKPFEWLENW